MNICYVEQMMFASPLCHKNYISGSDEQHHDITKRSTRIVHRRTPGPAHLGRELGKVVEAGEARDVVHGVQQPRHIAHRMVQPLQAVAAPRAVTHCLVARQERTLRSLKQGHARSISSTTTANTFSAKAAQRHLLCCPRSLKFRRAVALTDCMNLRCFCCSSQSGFSTCFLTRKSPDPQHWHQARCAMSLLGVTLARTCEDNCSLQPPKLSNAQAGQLR